MGTWYIYVYTWYKLPNICLQLFYSPTQNLIELSSLNTGTIVVAQLLDATGKRKSALISLFNSLHILFLRENDIILGLFLNSNQIVSFFKYPNVFLSTAKN